MIRNQTRSRKIKVMAVDDEELICWSLSKELGKKGYEVVIANSGNRALEILDQEAPDVVMLDNILPGMSGLDVLREIKRRDPSTIVIFMTAYSSVRTAVQAMKQGAFEYVTKPLDFDEIRLLILRALEANKIEREIAELHREFKKQYGLSNLVGQTPVMQENCNTIRRIAHSGATMVLIQGESGVGKEVAARAIHYESSRFDKPFVTINCTAMPETLLEGELFGHERGAFTDAKQMKKGQLEFGAGGTVFLDEIGDISPAVQVKLLHLLENRSFKRLGGVRDIQLDACIVVASNRNLRDAAQQGVFREDLYYRLNVIQLWIPALRERREDIPLLCKHFIDRYNHEFGRQVQGVEPEADQALREYDWPGNIRELRNVIERALILGSESLIGLDHLPSEITSRRTRDTAHAVFNIQIPDEGISLEEVEKSLVRAALKQTGGNQSRAARMLSISRDALRYKMQRFGLFPTHRQQTDD